MKKIPSKKLYEIASVFLAWCDNHGIALRTAAFMVGVDHSYLIQIEKGTRMVSGRVISKMVRAMEKDKTCKNEGGKDKK